MPAAEVGIDASLVRALLQAQHPDLADLPIVAAGSGWDNALYRLGDRVAVRLPRRAAAAALIEHEQRWLPELASRLPLAVPLPVRIGRAGSGYPWSWSVVPWLPGENAARARLDNLEQAARHLGECVGALHQPAPGDAPLNPVRGVPLAERHDVVLERIRRVEDLVDASALLDLWTRLSGTRPWAGPPL